MATGLFIGFGVFTAVFVLVLIGNAGWLFASRKRRCQELASQRRWQDAAKELEASGPSGSRAYRSPNRADSPAIVRARPLVVENDAPDLLGGLVNAVVAEEIIDSFDFDRREHNAGAGSTPDLTSSATSGFSTPDPAPSVGPGPSFDGGSTGLDTGTADAGSGFGGDGGSF